MIEVWRGALAEETHFGHAVVVGRDGRILHAWGDPQALIYPRSSCKIIQALPLLESGAADIFGLGSRHLALACASHTAAAVHTDLVSDWLAAIGRGESDLRCGPQVPGDAAARDDLVRRGESPCQLHNNCSGKHTGFLTLTKHLKADAEYLDIDHPVQRAFRDAFADLTGQDATQWGVDGCSAPNFVCTVNGLAQSMARLANAGRSGGVRDQAAKRLVDAMRAHPELVGGEGNSCTDLMRAMAGRGIAKVGGSDVYAAMLPEQGIGIAVKMIDGSALAVRAAITALLVKVGALDVGHPVVAQYLTGPTTNRRGLVTGGLRVADGFV